jgi:hypothetical protein
MSLSFSAKESNQRKLPAAFMPTRVAARRTVWLHRHKKGGKLRLAAFVWQIFRHRTLPLNRLLQDFKVNGGLLSNPVKNKPSSHKK